MRRLLPVALLAAMCGTALVVGSGAQAVEADDVPRAVVERPVEPGARVEYVKLEAPLPADRALARIERRQERLEQTIGELVASGTVSEDEGAALHAISEDTLDEAEGLVRRVHDGEIGWVGAFVRGVPLRIRHVTRVVDTIGYDRAAAIGQQRREARRERWAGR